MDPMTDAGGWSSIDGTPRLDLKPYVPAFDARDDVRICWYADRLDRVEGAVADDRFR